MTRPHLLSFLHCYDFPTMTACIKTTTAGWLKYDKVNEPNSIDSCIQTTTTTTTTSSTTTIFPLSSSSSGEWHDIFLLYLSLESNIFSILPTLDIFHTNLVMTILPKFLHFSITPPSKPEQNYHQDNGNHCHFLLYPQSTSTSPQ